MKNYSVLNMQIYYNSQSKIQEVHQCEGILIPDMQKGRSDIRFSSDDCYGGMHCGTTMGIWLNERWVSTRIEMDSRGWFLVGVQAESLWGQRGRIP